MTISFHNVSQVQRKAPEDCEMLLIGNKCDKDPMIEPSKPSELAALYSMSYYPTSAKVGSNVSEAFQQLATALVSAER